MSHPPCKSLYSYLYQMTNGFVFTFDQFNHPSWIKYFKKRKNGSVLLLILKLGNVIFQWIFIFMWIFIFIWKCATREPNVLQMSFYVAFKRLSLKKHRVLKHWMKNFQDTPLWFAERFFSLSFYFVMTEIKVSFVPFEIRTLQPWF